LTLAVKETSSRLSPSLESGGYCFGSSRPEQFTPLGVELYTEKTKVVDLLKGEAFGFLGFDLRRTRKRERTDIISK
jgi:hypothetical protein